jgi:hypothetical protein
MTTGGRATSPAPFLKGTQTMPPTLNTPFEAVAGVPGGSIARDPFVFDDFMAGGCAMDAALANESDPAGKFSFTADAGEWLVTTDGTKAAAMVTIVDAAGTAASDGGGGGVLRLTPGTTAADFVSIQRNGAPFITRTTGQGRRIAFQTRIKTNDADDIKFLVGLATPDVTGSTVGPLLDGTTAGFYFRNAAGNTTSFYAVCESASTETEVAITAATLADDTWIDLRIEVENRDVAKFYVNGALAATIKTNIPLTTEGLTCSYEVSSPTGTTATLLDIDLDYAAQTRA